MYFLILERISAKTLARPSHYNMLFLAALYYRKAKHLIPSNVCYLICSHMNSHYWCFSSQNNIWLKHCACVFCFYYDVCYNWGEYYLYISSINFSLNANSWECNMIRVLCSEVFFEVIGVMLWFFFVLIKTFLKINTTNYYQFCKILKTFAIYK